MKRCLIPLLALVIPVFAHAQPCESLVVGENAELTQAVPSWGMYSYDIARGNFSGGPEEDALELLLFSSVAPATVELGSGVNANWESCSECLLFNEDLDGVNSARMLFQASGQLTLGAAPGAATMPLTFQSVRLVEVTIDDMEHSTPVPGGKCLDLVTDNLFRSGFE